MPTIPPSVSMLQSSSRYETEAVAAVYLEAEWSDMLFGSTDDGDASALNPMSQRAKPSFYKRIAEIAVSSCAEFSINPLRVCDVGAATGRTIYELVRQSGEIQEALALEPSRLLHEWSQRLLGGTSGFLDVPIVAAWNSPMSRVVEISPIMRFDGLDKICLLNTTLESLPKSAGHFDLVICCNLLDRHPSPDTLVKSILERLKPGGVLILSSPLEFGIDVTDTFTEIGSTVSAFLPESSWTIHSTFEEFYDLRLYWRKWVRYVSQVVVARRS